ncbi:MAG: isochorismate synthase [Deltaproteobacteria bacterium]|nr:isochorismate synthase [Deltaproteobacteria bacterium]
MNAPLLDPAFVEEAIADLRPRLRRHRDAFVALTAPCRVEAFGRLVATDVLGDRFVWDTRGVAQDMGPSVVALGAVAQLAYTTETPRLLLASSAAPAIFRGIVEHRAPGCESAPALAMYGGAAFSDDPGAPSGWGYYPREQWSLPRWRVAMVGTQAFVTWILRLDELHENTRARVNELSLANDVVLRSPTLRLGQHRLVRRDDLSLSQWSDYLDRALAAISSGAFEKLVLARRSRFVLDRPLDLAACVSRAGAAQPSCVRFLLERSGYGFVGASPERLVRVAGRRVSTDALAGSVARTASDSVKTLTESLLLSDKIRREHDAVVRQIRDALGPMCVSLEVPTQPVARELPSLVHLWTPIEGELRSEQTVLDVAARLHPTPAVAGLPREGASAWIAANEPASRGWYAGPMGYFDARGDGALVVALRSMLVHRDSAWIYAGAGVVRGSVAEDEYRETEVKMAAMIAALGLGP